MKLGSAEVSFHHLQNEKVTFCTLVAKGKVFNGIAKCSNEDHFNRHTGRKVSLTEAMRKSNSTLSKIQKKNVWNAYRDLTKIPRW